MGARRYPREHIRVANIEGSGNGHRNKEEHINMVTFFCQLRIGMSLAGSPTLTWSLSSIEARYLNPFHKDECRYSVAALVFLTGGIRQLFLHGTNTVAD